MTHASARPLRSGAPLGDGAAPGIRRLQVVRPSASVAFARSHLAHHHAVPQALGPVVGEALAFVHRAGAVVEERRVRLPNTAGVVGEALDQASAGLGDQVDGSAQGDSRQALTSMGALDLDTGDPVVGKSLGSGEILLAVVDVGQLLGCSVLGSSNGEVAVEDQRRVCDLLVHAALS